MSGPPRLAWGLQAKAGALLFGGVLTYGIGSQVLPTSTINLVLRPRSASDDQESRRYRFAPLAWRDPFSGAAWPFYLFAGVFVGVPVAALATLAPRYILRAVALKGLRPTWGRAAAAGLAQVLTTSGVALGMGVPLTILLLVASGESNARIESEEAWAERPVGMLAHCMLQVLLYQNHSFSSMDEAATSHAIVTRNPYESNMFDDDVDDDEVASDLAVRGLTSALEFINISSALPAILPLAILKYALLARQWWLPLAMLEHLAALTINDVLSYSPGVNVAEAAQDQGSSAVRLMSDEEELLDAQEQRILPPVGIRALQQAVGLPRAGISLARYQHVAPKDVIDELNSEALLHGIDVDGAQAPGLQEPGSVPLQPDAAEVEAVWLQATSDSDSRA